MYVSSFGISFHQHLNTKQKQARSSVLHLQELPQAEVPRTTDMGDTPLAKASATFNDLFPMGFALHQPKKKSRFTPDQLNYIKERFNKGRSATAKKAKPQDVEQEMRYETIEGPDGRMRARFPPNLLLSESQVKYLFAKMAANIRVGDILTEQEDQDENSMQAESQAAIDEGHLNDYEVEEEAQTVFEVKELSQIDSDVGIVDHPIMVCFEHLILIFATFSPHVAKMIQSSMRIM